MNYKCKTYPKGKHPLEPLATSLKGQWCQRFVEHGQGDVEEIHECRLHRSAAALLAACRILVAHAQETYPHFESPRGQADIKQALAAIDQATGGTQP